jgi:hypothetical protein
LEAFCAHFVIQQERYRALLKITTDLERRGVIKKLLIEEEAKLKKYDDEHKKKERSCAMEARPAMKSNGFIDLRTAIINTSE